MHTLFTTLAGKIGLFLGGLLVLGGFTYSVVFFTKLNEERQQNQQMIFDLKEELEATKIQPEVKNIQISTPIDPVLKIEQCKAYATNQAQKHIEAWVKTLPPQNCTGGDLECFNTSLKIILAQTDYQKRTAYDQNYQSCLK